MDGKWTLANVVAVSLAPSLTSFPTRVITRITRTRRVANQKTMRQGKKKTNKTKKVFFLIRDRTSATLKRRFYFSKCEQ